MAKTALPANQWTALTAFTVDTLVQFRGATAIKTSDPTGVEPGDGITIKGDQFITCASGITLRCYPLNGAGVAIHEDNGV